jgi:tetratricopeptide (TPR) repeat protein
MEDRGRLDKAELLYASVLASHPRNFDALHRLGILHFRAARHAEALRCLTGAVEARPTAAPALANLARLQANLGLKNDALANFERAVAAKPDFAEAQFNRAQMLRDLGRPLEAVEGFAKAAALRPGDAETILMLGVALREVRRLPEALAALDRALVLNPGSAKGHNIRGAVLRDMGRSEEALTAIDRALALDQNFADAWSNRGVALLCLVRPGDALAAFYRALALKPDSADFLHNCASALKALCCDEEALAFYDRALAVRPEFAAALAGRAAALQRLGRSEEALQSCLRALALQPDLAIAYHNKGFILAELGRLEEACASIEEALRLDPASANAYFTLTVVKRMRADDPHIAAMEALADASRPLPPADRAKLHFALGKALEDSGDRERSFRCLLEANAMQRKLTPYDEAATLAGFRSIETALGADFLSRHAGAGDPSSAPVFIVGMPRSGTSLVEQILASHPQVFGAGELDEFERETTELLPSPPGESLGADLAALVERGRARELGARYSARLASLAPGAMKITDKMPLNFRFAGLIHLALPNARVIAVRRNPVDTCLSCFSKLFAGNLHWAYDLAELGRYYLAYESLMAHWRAVLPERVMIEVRYEDLVVDVEGQTRRLLAHCGLEWDPRCLDFHTTPRSVRTASLVQVRQPVHSGSIERWRAHEERLGPLLRELGPSTAAYARERAAGA